LNPVQAGTSRGVAQKSDSGLDEFFPAAVAVENPDRDHSIISSADNIVAPVADHDRLRRKDRPLGRIVDRNLELTTTRRANVPCGKVVRGRSRTSHPRASLMNDGAPCGHSRL
jgi:hypothetical protein